MTCVFYVMKRFSKILLILTAALTPLVTWAAVSFTVQAPRQVSQGNKFNVTYVLNNAEGSGFSAPDISGATKLYGPALSTSYSSVSVNGRSSSSSSQEYTMIYKANKVGKYRIGGASIMVNGKRLTTRSFTIEIVPSGQHVSGNAQSSASPNGVKYSDPMTQTAGKAVKANDLFVRIEMSKKRIFEQEAVVCTIKLYTKYQISQFFPTLQPSFNGFLIEELPLSPNLNKIERVNGENYMVAELKKCILFPQQSGKLTITSGNYDLSVVQYDTYRSVFGTLSQPVERKLQVKSNSATVYIEPLPEPKPANFSGAVGNFTVDATVKPADLKTYAAATYSYIIKGTGNLKYIKAPNVKFPKQFDVYDPQNKVAAAPNGSNVSGTLAINYMFIPQFAGDFEIPANDFVYFNPESGKYVTLKTRSFSLHVAKGKGTPSSHYKIQNLDIRRNATDTSELSKTTSFVISSVWYWLGYVVPVVALAVILLIYRKQLKERADSRLMRRKRASKLARKRLKRAKALLAANDSNGFYAELSDAMWGYLSDKLNIPGSELSKDNISAELDKFGVDQELRDATMDLLNKCEFAQYAPELAKTDMNTVLSEAAALMDKLETVKRIGK